MGLIAALKLWGNDLLDVIFPKCCEVCGSSLVDGEEVMCLQCSFDMPRCNIHRDEFNTLHQRLASNVPVEMAAGYFYYYRKSPYTKLIHAAKYNGRPNVARILARNFAGEIVADGFFQSIDMILPVPLHRFKQLRRGYNQSDHIAQGISDATGIPVGYNLKCTKGHASQTRRNAYERWLNSRNIYSAENGAGLDGRHVLIVDDVVTTGATMLACCEAVQKVAPTARISVLALGVTRLQ